MTPKVMQLVVKAANRNVDSVRAIIRQPTNRSILVNILDSLKEQLGEGLAGQFGNVLGESEDDTKGAMDGMLGVILGSVLGKASTPAGAEELSKKLDRHDDGIPDSVGDLFGGDGQKKLAEKGSEILGSLLGGNLGDVGDLFARTTGMKSESVLSMLSMLAPLVMSFLGKLKKSQGLDANGFASMLMTQKDNVASAIPEGMADAMGIPNNLLSTAGHTVSSTARSAGNTVHQTAQQGSGVMKILLPALIIGALGYLGYRQFTGTGTTAGRDAIEQKPTETGEKGTRGLSVPGLPKLPAIEGLGDMGKDVTGVFSSIQETLGGIKDEASATEAVRKLEGITEKLGGMSDGFTALPEATRTGLSSQITSKLLPMLTAAIDKAKAIPGVGAIIDPAIKALMDKIGTFTR